MIVQNGTVANPHALKKKKKHKHAHTHIHIHTHVYTYSNVFSEAAYFSKNMLHVIIIMMDRSERAASFSRFEFSYFIQKILSERPLISTEDVK